MLSVSDDGIFSGSIRPSQIPPNWVGEPLPDDAGWRWSDPGNRSNAVRLFRGDPNSVEPDGRDPYVVVTVDGHLVDNRGERTGQRLLD
jgi:hypothetical protein